jgi:FixJ family two-component response regulator
MGGNQRGTAPGAIRAKSTIDEYSGACADSADEHLVKSIAVTSQNVFVIDDDPSVRKALQRLIRSAGMDAEAFGSAEDFLAESHSPADCLVLDVRMPGMSGLELQQLLIAKEQPIPIVFISAHDDEECRRSALAAGATDFLHKPFEDRVLLDAIARAIAHIRAEADQTSERPE